jgi:hypothetical protein
MNVELMTAPIPLEIAAVLGVLLAGIIGVILSVIRRRRSRRASSEVGGCLCRFLSAQSLAVGRHCTYCHDRRIGRCMCAS